MKKKKIIFKSNHGWALIVKNTRNLAMCRTIANDGGAKKIAAI